MGQSSSRCAAANSAHPTTCPHSPANANDPASLDALAQRASVVLTTVGPYQLYGEALVAACARAGTDYVDLCGEPAWMAQMIARYEKRGEGLAARASRSPAASTRSRSIAACSICSSRRWSASAQPFARVRGRVRKMKGGVLRRHDGEHAGDVGSGPARSEHRQDDGQSLRAGSRPRPACASRAATS